MASSVFTEPLQLSAMQIKVFSSYAFLNPYLFFYIQKHILSCCYAMEYSFEFATYPYKIATYFISSNENILFYLNLARFLCSGDISVYILFILLSMQ